MAVYDSYVHSSSQSQASFLRIASVCVEFSKETSNIVLLKPSIAADVNAMRHYQPTVTPPPHRVGMNMKKLGYFPRREHRDYLVTTKRIFSHRNSSVCIYPTIYNENG